MWLETVWERREPPVLHGSGGFHRMGVQMPKVTHHDAVSAYVELSETIAELRKSFDRDPADLEISEILDRASAYVAASTDWMKAYPANPGVNSDIEFSEPLETINEAIEKARSALQAPHGDIAMRAFVTAVAACHHSTAKVYSLVP
jgi:hypothetical protein